MTPTEDELPELTVLEPERQRSVVLCSRFLGTVLVWEMGGVRPQFQVDLFYFFGLVLVVMIHVGLCLRRFPHSCYVFGQEKGLPGCFV